MTYSGWTVAWSMWFAFFLVIEGWALIDKDKNDTLSEHIWHFFAVRDKPWGWRLRRFVLLAFMAWLSVHFLTGGHY